MFKSLIVLSALLFCSVFCFSQAAAKPVPCDQTSAYHRLDFWIGNWDVFDMKTGEKGGTNRIEKILKGCAIIENWTEASDGSEGKSLFYFQPAKGQWKQVWVTDIGPMKEKIAQNSYTGEGIRFQGEIPHRDGTSHLDRTTLIPLSGGKVRQTIEISRDAGKSWEVVFDAEYRRQMKPRKLHN
jgi:hypothetical protein